ncbi:MBL fold metallo-hydrolase, partial [Fulvivirga lutimaris]|uniref:MBL fold metallo-hydrolase n=1 Tax=Fulvivirga lutimaris TaxID=1819566 RepID=UPI0012BBF248
MSSKQFGGKIKKEHLALYEQSPNWRNGKFQNLEETSLSISLYKIPGLIYKQLKGRKDREPKAPLPIMPFDKEAFLAPSAQMKFIWYGHSVILMRLNNKTILIDPMLGPNTSPIAPFGTYRYSENTLDLIDQFPEIDLLMMTHDHYDHLDYDSIKKLKHKTKKYFVGMGVKRHLVKWGIEPDIITEFDWWNNQSFEDISITYTPTRHFSGRGLTDRAKSLWGGWAFKTANENIWFSGDSGYGAHFKDVGEKLGP